MADPATPSTPAAPEAPAAPAPDVPTPGAPDAPASEAPAAPAPDAPAEPAPWGEDFDAARAWKLVQNLRQEKDDLKADRDRLKGTPQEGKPGEADALTAAEQRAAAAERELYLERVYRAHPELDSDDFRDFLTGDTEEEIKAKADRLARLGKPKEDDQGNTPPPAPSTPGKPTPSLVPGHGGEEPPSFDPVAIAKAARR